MNHEAFARLITEMLATSDAWRTHWGAFSAHPSMHIPEDRLQDALQDYYTRLGGNFPFFHPRYAGQMLKPPHPIAMLGYWAAMFHNPNNHALDGGRPTSEMEKEVIRQLAHMFRLPQNTLGHLTSGGTTANLEALWVARQLHPHRKIAFSADAHYTHGRMAEVLGLGTVVIPSDNSGKMDVVALENVLKTGTIGTVVMTVGTTGLGALDPVQDVLPFRETYDIRIHVDSAYGGFFAIPAWEDTPMIEAAPYRAIAQCDSVVVDPHKHGLQPYGCGAVLFRDPTVGRFYQHDSPYTYFSSDELHLGEISLECSRAGATAGALWLTLQCLPLEADQGFGPILKAGLRAARNWADVLRNDPNWALFMEPALDILAYFPKAAKASEIDQLSQAIFEEAMVNPDSPVFTSVYRVPAEKLRTCLPDLVLDVDQVRILRSVLMKPEHEGWVPKLHAALSEHRRTVALRLAQTR